jgi:hypothetical protein
MLTIKLIFEFFAVTTDFTYISRGLWPNINASLEVSLFYPQPRARITMVYQAAAGAAAMENGDAGDAAGVARMENGDAGDAAGVARMENGDAGDAGDAAGEARMENGDAAVFI